MNGSGLAFEAVVTLEDMVAFHCRLLSSPAMRKGRLRRELGGILVGVVCAPVGFVLATWIMGLSDPNRASFTEIVEYLLQKKPSLLVMAAVFVPVCIAAAMIAQRLLVRSRLRRVFRRILRARAGVDPADPRLAFSVSVAVGDDGMESRSAAGSVLVPWSTVFRWEEEGGRIMVLGAAMNGFCLNVTSIDPVLVEQFRSRLAAQLGPSRMSA